MKTKPESRWEPMYPVGYPAAIDSMGSIAAPFLASITVAVFVFVTTDPKHLRWPHATLALLLVAFFALLTSVQMTFRARQYVATPSEIQEWWPNDDADSLILARRNQRYHWLHFHFWAHWARRAYNVGLLGILAAIATIAAPRHVPVSFGSWVVLGRAIGAFAAEVLWMLADYWNRNAAIALPEVGPEWIPK